jgi:hypothetical protein
VLVTIVGDLTMVEREADKAARTVMMLTERLDHHRATGGGGKRKFSAQSEHCRF